jgi:hypothetical protein
MKFFVFLFAFLSVSCFGVEYKRGLVIPNDWRTKTTFVSAKTRGFVAPTEFDWRTQKTISPVMNQGNCGSCWAFSSSATFRDANIVQGGTLGENAVQEVLDCNAKNYGCDGGFFDVDQFFVSPGAALQSVYGAYVGKKQTCKTVAKYAKATSWHYVSQNGNGTPSEDEMKAAIMAWGPISIGVAAGSSWSSYTGGIYTACSNKQLNHAVQLVGWSDSGKYWILRNSWGTSWGENGYMRIAYKNSAGQPCDGVGEAANFFKVSNEPVPDPTPGPTPPPEPTPGPCTLPKATTGYGASIKAMAGRIYYMGKGAVKGVTYRWSAEPAFSNGAVPTSAQIRYQPIVTKTLTITATNECGSASASTQVILPATKVQVYY